MSDRSSSVVTALSYTAPHDCGPGPVPSSATSAGSSGVEAVLRTGNTPPNPLSNRQLRKFAGNRKPPVGTLERDLLGERSKFGV